MSFAYSKNGIDFIIDDTTTGHSVAGKLTASNQPDTGARAVHNGFPYFINAMNIDWNNATYSYTYSWIDNLNTSHVESIGITITDTPTLLSYLSYAYLASGGLASKIDDILNSGGQTSGEALEPGTDVWSRYIDAVIGEQYNNRMSAIAEDFYNGRFTVEVNNSKSAAQNAVNTANTAVETATTASTTATNAASTANEASQTANDAYNTANNAYENADTAQQTADAAQVTSNRIRSNYVTASIVVDDEEEDDPDVFNPDVVSYLAYSEGFNNIYAPLAYINALAYVFTHVAEVMYVSGFFPGITENDFYGNYYDGNENEIAYGYMSYFSYNMTNMISYQISYNYNEYTYVDRNENINYNSPRMVVNLHRHVVDPNLKLMFKPDQSAWQHQMEGAGEYNGTIMGGGGKTQNP